MNLDLQKQLFDKHPLFFRKPADESDAGPLDYWGIETGNGWFGLIDKVSASFEKVIADLVLKGVPIQDCPRAGQIKQKLGAIRIYTGTAEDITPSIQEAMIEARRSASQTCETCGKPGSKRDGAWIHVACDQCESSKPINLTTEGEMDQHMKELRDLLESRRDWNGNET